jgi:hypothetical protein
MSAPTTIRRELLNIAFLSFIPAGELVDAVTVSATTWPDNTPTTNWTAYQIPDVESLTLVKEYDSETFKVPKTSGKRLENGLATVPVVGTAQSPFVDNNNFIEGVFLLEIQNKNGAVTERMQLWGRLRLESPGDTGPATRKLEFSIEKRDSGNNSYVLVA